MTDKSPWADRCPSCDGPNNEPQAITEDGHSANCTYRCSACGHRWVCSWGLARSYVTDDGHADCVAS